MVDAILPDDNFYHFNTKGAGVNKATEVAQLSKIIKESIEHGNWAV